MRSILREPVSAITHGLGTLLAIIGTIWLVIAAPNDALTIVAVVVYGVCMSFMFFASTMLHSVTGSRYLITLFNRLDHVGIHLMIAGSYTAICLLALEGPWRVGLVAGAWVLNGIGIIDKIVNFQGGSIRSTMFYMFTGWLAVVGFPELLASVSLDVMRLIVAGGLLFTVGAMVYSFDDPKVRPLFNTHDVWHLFVLGGSAAHFAAIAQLALG